MQDGLRIYTATLIVIMTMFSLIRFIFANTKSQRIASLISLIVYAPAIYYFIRF